MDDLSNENIKPTKVELRIPIYTIRTYPESSVAVMELLDVGWLTRGYYADTAEAMLEERLEVKHALLTSSGSTAMHLAIETMLHKYPETKRFIVPNNVYVAAVNPILYSQKRVTDFVMLDPDKDTWNITLDQLDMLESNDNLLEDSILIVVHNLGNPVPVSKIKSKYPELHIIEDCCEALGAEENGHKVGTLSDMAIYSFYANKHITCGEGGLVTTQRTELYDYAKALHGQGVIPSQPKYVHEYLGYNYRITELQAAYLYGQVPHLDKVLVDKERVFHLYKKQLSRLKVPVTWQKIEANTVHSNWMFGIDCSRMSGEAVAKFLSGKGIVTRPMFKDLAEHSYMNMTSDTNLFADTKLLLPSYPDLTEKDIKRICSALKECFQELDEVAEPLVVALDKIECSKK